MSDKNKEPRKELKASKPQGKCGCGCAPVKK
jgi:hypothetical protein